MAIALLAACEPTADPPLPSATSVTADAPPAALVTATMPADLAAYPPPLDTLAPYPEPWLTASPTGMSYPAPTEVSTQMAAAEPVYFPVIGEGAPPTATPPPPTATPTSVPTPVPTVVPTSVAAAVAPESATPVMPTPTPTPFAPIDFEAAGTDLGQQGQELVYNKMGLHVTFPGDSDELDTYMQRLDAAGVPFFLKAVDNAEPLYRAQELMKVSGVDHTLVFRSTKFDVPNYDADPIEAAEYYWEQEKALWPPELDPQRVWLETMNEVDRNHSEWLAAFAKRTAELALRDGYKWAAFGWASGEPEPEAWRSPAMLDLLELMGEHPDQLAIALHEYSYVTDNIGHDYPYKVGRFLDLFRAADENGIPRPTVLITEWGWTYDAVPPPDQAMADIRWAAGLYGAFPQVKGAAIWNLGKLNNELLALNDQVGGLVDPLMVMSLNSFFSAPAPPEQTATDASQFPPP